MPLGTRVDDTRQEVSLRSLVIVLRDEALLPSCHNSVPSKMKVIECERGSCSRTRFLAAHQDQHAELPRTAVLPARTTKGGGSARERKYDLEEEKVRDF
ncbi:hypothetical protein QQF64_007015 [Cirrhinus molitorella]|uniref:Uncharacterized protein n=1 Tax=Cirrhinus molitorella TaxID=172907 RepID=A0ABR3MA50_9TELE